MFCYKGNTQSEEGVKNKIHFTFCIIWTVLLLNILYWGGRKEGYYIDELWSYGLANSYYEPFLQEQEGYMDQWHEPEFYLNYLTVNSGEAFSYASVYDNQVNDVHPPLYYMLLHTVCSLFKGGFTKWYGLMVNSLFFGGTVWLLYMISGLMLGRDNYARLIPPVIYGISGGGIAAALYIRMYMMLIFWGLLYIYLTFLLMEKENKRKVGALVWLMVTSVAGSLTQYYFLVFAFFISCGYVFYKGAMRCWRDLTAYVAVVISGIGGGVLIFPASLDHIFKGYKGQESMENVFRESRALWEQLVQYGEVVLEGFFFHRLGLGWAVLGTLLLGTITVLAGLWQKRQEGRGCAVFEARFWILTVVLLGYFLMISQISTDISDRYQFMVYPVMVLVAVTVFFCLGRQIRVEKGIWVLAAGYICFCIWHYKVENIHYIYPGYEAAMYAITTEYQNVPGIYVTKGDHLVINNSLFLAQQTMTYPIKAEDLEKLPEICKGKEKDQMILYVDIYYDEYQIAEEVAELLGYSSYELLYDNTFSQIFCLSRQESRI